MKNGLSAFALALACCVPSTVERHRLADGSWQLTCRLPMDECARQADVLCVDQRYRILRGQSGHVFRGVAPSQVDYRTSELTFVCSNYDDGTSADASAPQTARSPGDAPPFACTPGATQACVGPGACAGGQACLSDGTRFGPCDCGPPKREGIVDSGPIQGRPDGAPY